MDNPSNSVIYRELENCRLCAWKCGVDRLAGEKGVCLMGTPEVASCQLHPAPPQSYTIFMVGCSFKCLNCQNWEIAHYPRTKASIRGYVDPNVIAQEGVDAIHSVMGKLLRADRFFFSGGSPTVSLPWIEEVVSHVKTLDPHIKVNFDTNGFPSRSSFQRILSFSDSITFDIKAFHDEVHRALTGAPVEPVLKNAEEMARYYDQLWEFRILVIPSIIDLAEVQAIVEFIAGLDETLPVSFLTFRPNFCLDSHPGASEKLMRKAVSLAHDAGLVSVNWAGFPDIPGKMCVLPPSYQNQFTYLQTAYAMYYANQAGCKQTLRYCKGCKNQVSCKLKGYTPFRRE
ncbi:MAG: radical SAM protein, partial [Candidatus Hodarchaeota archaeon]